MGAYMGAFGGRPYLHFLVPGVLVTAVMMSSSFECLYGTYIKIVHEKVYDSLIATPVSADEAVAGDIAWGSFRGLISGSLMMTVALAMGVTPASPLACPCSSVFMVFIKASLRRPGHDRHLGRAELRFLQLLHGSS
jgi:lipooligosaccharide transport system permease protein